VVNTIYPPTYHLLIMLYRI